MAIFFILLILMNIEQIDPKIISIVWKKGNLKLVQLASFHFKFNRDKSNKIKAMVYTFLRLRVRSPLYDAVYNSMYLVYSPLYAVMYSLLYTMLYTLMYVTIYTTVYTSLYAMMYFPLYVWKTKSI